MRRGFLAVVVISSLAVAAPGVRAQQTEVEITFPIKAELFADEPFGGTEGIAFNGEGRLFVTGSTSATDQAFWEINLDGSVRRIVDLDSTLGVAGYGARDLLVADFGPTNAFRDDRNSDGIIWHITPEGAKEAWATGIGDPNFIVVRRDGTVLVSDDATADIYVIGADRLPRLFSTAVNHPNGLAFNADESVLYVAQIFKSIRPVVRDDSVWALRLGDDGRPLGAAKRVARLGPYAANDGLTMDRLGRIYVAANGEAGQIWRVNPAIDETVLIAENVFGAASIAFGEGEFDHRSIYVSTTFNGGRGGKIWRVPVGVEGIPLNR